jgi:hypothetical protein
MASALISPFKDDTIVEVVPDVVKVAGKLSQSSVITGRRRIRVVPQTGQTYTLAAGGSSGIVNILLQDGGSYADLTSAVLSFDVITWDSANAGNLALSDVCVDEGIYSVFRRAVVTVNSTQADDRDLLAKATNAEILATCSQSWYDNCGTWMGLWNRNTSSLAAASAGATVDANKYAVQTKLTKQAAVQQVDSATGTGNPAVYGQNHYSVPVSFLSDFFRNETLLPLRNAGQVYLQLQLASAIEATLGVAQGAGVTPVPNVQISNVTMEIDMIDLHPSYLSMMDSLIEAPEGDGVRWAFDAHLSATALIPAAAGDTSAIFSKASQNLRAIQVITQPSAGLGTVGYSQQGAFANPGFRNIQSRVGSTYYPAFMSVGEARAFQDLQNAFGSPGNSVDKSGLIDTKNYYLATPGTGFAGTQASNNNGSLIAAGVAGSSANAAYKNCDAWSWGYCFDRLKHGKFDHMDLDGVNTLTSSGSQLVVQINCSPLEALTMAAFIRYTRVLVLQGGATRIMG